jgi:hypothetical protein
VAATASVSEVIVLVASWAVSTALCFAVIVRDERRLDDETLARAWPPPSRDCAIIGLGLFAVPFHFIKTRSRSMWPWRWSPRGLALGVAWTLVVLIGNVAVVLALDLALGLEP